MRTEGLLRKRLLMAMAAAAALVALVSTASVAANWQSEEAKRMEMRVVQAAVAIMMAKNNITTLPNPVTVPTSNMSFFPDATTRPEVKGLHPGDGSGYVLRGHDMIPDGQPGSSVDYIGTLSTRWAYTVTPTGTVLKSVKYPE